MVRLSLDWIERSISFGPKSKISDQDLTNVFEFIKNIFYMLVVLKV